MPKIGQRITAKQRNLPLFQRFRVHINVEAPSIWELFDRYNLIGFDFGDAEMTACTVQLDENGLPSVKMLFFGRRCTKLFAPSILGNSNSIKRENSGETLPFHARLLESSGLGRGRIYSNFKYHPLDPKIEEHYDGDPEAPTNGELMGHCFGCALKCLFDCNTTELSINKPTLVLVGRPAGEKWQKMELRYTSILSRYLGDYLGEKTARDTAVIAVSESSAAMAGALGLNPEKWKQVVQILDLGSSTFDSLLTTPNGIPLGGSDSYQFGGRILDQAMAAYGDYLCRQAPESKDCRIVSQPGKFASLRFKKEECYGVRGDADENTVQKYLYELRPHRNAADISRYTRIFEYEITRKRIEDINQNTSGLPELECKVEKQQGNALGNRPDSYRSWMEACTNIMTKFYENSKPFYPNNVRPDLLILSGGVANMPEVIDVAERVFQTKAVIPDDPKDTVAMGLGRILGSEFTKEYIMQRLLKRLFSEQDIFPSVSELRQTIIKCACSSDLDFYGRIMEKWANQEGSNIQDCISAFYEAYDTEEDIMALVVRKLFQGRRSEWIGEQICQALQRLLPDIKENFTFQVDSLDDTEGQDPENMNSWTLESPPLQLPFFFDEKNCPKEFANLDFSKTTDSEEYQKNQEQYQKIIDAAITKKRGYFEKLEMLKVFQKHRDLLENGGQIKYGQKCCLKISGFCEVYGSQIDDTTAVKCQETVEQWLRREIRAYVDSETYYLNLP